MVILSMNVKLFRTLALDLGDKHIGVAISDLSGTIANGLPTLHRTTLNKDLDYLINLIAEREVGLIVVGLPINMDGSMGERVDKTYAFVDELKKRTDIEVAYYDERLTTSMAEKVLISANTSRKKRKDVIDKVSAIIILQDFLNTHKRS